MYGLSGTIKPLLKTLKKKADSTEVSMILVQKVTGIRSLVLTDYYGLSLYLLVVANQLAMASIGQITRVITESLWQVQGKTRSLKVLYHPIEE
jgi:hypothetical protein